MNPTPLPSALFSVPLIMISVVVASCLSHPVYAFELPYGTTLDEWLDRTDEALYWESEGGTFAVDINGQVDLWWTYADDEGGPPGFWFHQPDEHWSFSPRLTITGDLYLGERFLLFGKLRWDDGIHPGLAEVLDTYSRDRIDMYFLRAEIIPGKLTAQIGQFPPIFGAFMARQESWDNGLISYPLLYENVTSVSDSIITANVQAFVNRANVADIKTTWLPVIWAPAYTQGLSLFGALGKWDYAFNYHNFSPSTRGNAWNEARFEHPAISGRLGYRPNPSWRLGANLSRGPYIQPEVEFLLPAGTDRGDYQHWIAGIDTSWKGGDWQVWAEAYYSTYEVPNVADEARIYSYFVEARRDFLTSFWASLRWNQEWYDTIDTPTGPTRWDNDLWRIDAGLGWRFLRHAHLKVQYSHQEQDAAFQNGRHFIASELTLRF